MADQDPSTPPAGSPDRPRRAPRRALSERARTGGSGPRDARTARSFALSVVLHVVAAGVLFQVLTFGHGMRWLRDLGESAPVEERISYVEPRPSEAAPAPVVASAPPAQQAPRTTGPVVGPSIPDTPPAATPRDTGSAPGTGAQGAGPPGAVDGDPNLRGVRPGYGDPRVWTPPVVGGAGGEGRGRTGADKLDSVISTVLTQATDSLDSIARASGAYGRRPGDWTKTDKNGGKWGWDNAGIRLGKVTIPNALLSLLPLNAQVGLSGNPTEIDRNRRVGLARQDIDRNALMGPGDKQFRELANELRTRREKERRERLRAPSADIVVGPQKAGNEKDKDR